MKKIVVVLLLVLCSTAIYGQKTRLESDKNASNPANYTVKIHISASHIECGSGACDLFADTVLNGKKIELRGGTVSYKRINMLLVPGDYAAKLINDSLNPNSAWFGQEYKLLLPDGTTWHCYTTGIFE
jgi:uncharacterized FAD-dependent dehydrogenase